MDYSDNFVSKNSSHADTNIHQLALQRVNYVVDCSACVLSGIQKERFYKAIIGKALTSAMTVFAHLNDYILLANFNFQNLLNT